MPMIQTTVRRRLAAILAADVVGYSRLGIFRLGLAAAPMAEGVPLRYTVRLYCGRMEFVCAGR
jgi:hypothetical protein